MSAYSNDAGKGRCSLLVGSVSVVIRVESSGSDRPFLLTSGRAGKMGKEMPSMIYIAIEPCDRKV